MRWQILWRSPSPSTPKLPKHSKIAPVTDRGDFLLFLFGFHYIMENGVAFFGSFLGLLLGVGGIVLLNEHFNPLQKELTVFSQGKD